MLLEYLMKNQGIVLSRGMIMEHVWDMNVDPFSNTIESHILSLRNKLGCKVKREKELIHTVSGRGYKIDLKSLGMLTGFLGFGFTLVDRQLKIPVINENPHASTRGRESG